MIVEVRYTFLRDERGTGTTVIVDVRYTMEDEGGIGTTVMVDVWYIVDDEPDESMPASAGRSTDGSCGCVVAVSDVRVASSCEGSWESAAWVIFGFGISQESNERPLLLGPSWCGRASQVF